MAYPMNTRITLDLKDPALIQLVQLEAGVKIMLSPDALSRYGAIKTAHPETAAQVVMVITQLAQRGQLRGVVDDVLMKRILSELRVERDITIVRK